MFAFSRLFIASQVAAGFDACIQRDAANGRVNHALAHLSAQTWGLPLLTPKAQPVNKAIALKLADSYRRDWSAYGIRGYRKQAQAGALLDALSAGLRLGDAASDADKLAELKAQGLYLGGVEDWKTALKPAAPTPEEVAAKAAKRAARAAKGTTPGTPTDDARQTVELTADELFDATMGAIASGALTPDQLGDLRAACSAALGLDAVVVVPDVVALPGAMVAGGLESVGMSAH